MHHDKIKELCQPRARVYLDRDTPRRIKKIIDHHQKVNEAFNQQIKHSEKGHEDQEEARSNLAESKIAFAQLKTYTEAKNMVLPRDKFMRPIIPR